MYLEDETVGIQNAQSAFIDRKAKDAEYIQLWDSITIAKAQELYDMVSELFFASRVYFNPQKKSIVVKIANARPHHARINDPSLFKAYEQFIEDNSVIIKRPNSARSTNLTLHVK